MLGSIYAEAPWLAPPNTSEGPRWGPLASRKPLFCTNTSRLLLVLRSFKGGTKKLYTCVSPAALVGQGGGRHSRPHM